jgi:hypothetical protein
MLNLRDLEAHWGGLVVSAEGHVIQFPPETFQLPSEREKDCKNGNEVGAEIKREKLEMKEDKRKSVEKKERQSTCARGNAREQSTAGVMLTRRPLEYPNLLLQGKSWRGRQTEWWFDDVEPGELPGKKGGSGTGEGDWKTCKSVERNGEADEKTEGDEAERKRGRLAAEAELNAMGLGAEAGGNGTGLGAEAEGNGTGRREAKGLSEGEDEKETNRGAECAERKDLDSGNGDVVGGWEESFPRKREDNGSGSVKEETKSNLGATRPKDGEYEFNGENSVQRAGTQKGKGLGSSLPSDENLGRRPRKGDSRTEDEKRPDKRRKMEREEEPSGISVGRQGQGRSISGSSFGQEERSGISEEVTGISGRQKSPASVDDRFGLLQKIRGARAMAKERHESDEIGEVASGKSNPGGTLKRTEPSWGSKKMRRREMPQPPLKRSRKGIEGMKLGDELKFLAEAEGDGEKERSDPEEETVGQERTERQSGRKGSKERSLKVSEGTETDAFRLRGGTGDESGVLGNGEMSEGKLADIIESCQEEEITSEAEIRQTKPPVAEIIGHVGERDSAAEKPSEAAYSAGSEPPEAPAGSKPPGERDSAGKNTSHASPTSLREPAQDDQMDQFEADSEGGMSNETMSDLSEDGIPPDWGGAQPGDNVGAAAAQSLAELLAQGVLDAVHPRGEEEVDLVKRVGVSVLIEGNESVS